MSYLEFCAVDNNPLSFTLGQAIHHLFYLICAGDSTGARCCPCVMPRPDKYYCLTKINPKGQNWRVTIRDPSRKADHLRKVIWDRNIIKEFTRFISSTKVGYPVLMMDDNSFQRQTYCLIKRTSSMLNEIASKTEHKGKQ